MKIYEELALILQAIAVALGIAQLLTGRSKKKQKKAKQKQLKE